MSVKIIQVTQSMLAGNEGVAARNRARFDAAGVLAVNFIASPGAGKTSLLTRTLQILAGRVPVGVIEGDIASSLDAERVLAAGAHSAVQINTGGGCHLEAYMVERALSNLDLSVLEMLFIENVGNLVCPNHWALGEHLKLCLASVAEGHDKPIKYPEVFAASDMIMLNKIDLLAFVEFDREIFYRDVRAVNPRAPIFEISCRSGVGLTGWVNWLVAQRLLLAARNRVNLHA